MIFSMVSGLAICTGAALGSLASYALLKRQYAQKTTLLQSQLHEAQQTLEQAAESGKREYNELEHLHLDLKNKSIEKITEAFYAGSDMMDDLSIKLEDIQSMTQSTDEPLKNIYAAGQQALEQANSGQKAMQKLDGSLQQLDELTVLLNGVIQHLEEINDKSQSIHDIANQANLLALNASIEAARAGEVGRGFAVVADDMKRLSELSGESAKEISDILTNGQSEMQTVVNRVNEKVSEFSEVSKDVLENFSSVEATISDVENLSNELFKISEVTLDRVKNVGNSAQTTMESLTKMLSDATGSISGNVIVDMEPPQAFGQLNEFKLIDVRRPNEYNDDMGHIDGAQLYCLQDNFKQAIADLPRNEKYLFICRSGGRSSRAARIAQAMGFSNVTNLAGGMLRWREHYPQ